MYKSKLQELCQRRRWELPEYTSVCEGMSHNPRFTAAVAVNGQTFRYDDFSRTSKDAQNKAAELAFLTLSAAADAEEPCAAIPEINIPFKSQLQNYAMKKHIDKPEYSCLRKGPSHAPQFMATVKFDGQTFDSDQYYHTIKEAEQAAARVALMSLPMEEIQQDDGVLYKNLLGELAQKENVSLPKYNTTSRGDCHMPIFSSVVEIKGEVFEGDPAKTKKQAEMNAAKVAWNQLNEYKLRNNWATASVPRILEEPIKVVLKDENNMKSSKLPSDDQKTASPSEHTVKSSTPSNINKIHLHGNNHSDAGVALMTSPTGEIQQDDRILYENILHDLAQKEAVSLPKYNTSSSGDCHMPKKQEENNVAKVTWIQLNENNLENNRVILSASRNLEKPIDVALNEDNAKSNKLPSDEQKTGTVKLSTPNGHKIYVHKDYHADTGVAQMSLAKEEIQQDDHVSYKSLLQEIVQKEKVSLPKYTTISIGNCRMPMFSSVVEIKGEFFEGDPAKTKKQAEMNAAKVAWIKLNECKVRNNGFNNTSVYVHTEKPIMITFNDEGKMISNKVSSDEQETASPNKWAINSSISSPCQKKTNLCSNDHLATSTNMNDQGIKGDDYVTSFQLLDLSTPAKCEDVQSALGSASPSINSALPNPTFPASTSLPSINSSSPHPTSPSSTRIGAKLLANRVQVYAHKSGMVLPGGATFLPIRGDKWVAVHLG